MAFSSTPVDMNRGTNSMALPPELARDIWQETQHASAIMQLAQRVELPGRGLTIPVLAQNPVADFVVETGEKPVDDGTPMTVNMTPYKIAVIVPMSKELVRDLPAMYDEVRRVLPYAIGQRFDAAVFNGPIPGTGFDTLAGSTEIDIAADAQGNVYQKLVQAMATIATYNGSANGFALHPMGKAFLMSSVDGTGRPFFDIAANSILGCRVVESPAINATVTSGEQVLGYVGDFTKARYGMVNDIEISVSDQATLNDGNGGLIHLWQRNMIALRAECELGFVVSNEDAFAALYASAGSE